MQTEDKDFWIKRMARHYNEPEEDLRKKIEKDQAILEGYIEWELNERYRNE
jgi:hypothetical protein